MSSDRYPCGMTRRGFLAGAAVGTVVGAPLGWLALRGTQRREQRTPFTGRSVEVARPTLGMPGPYPGRVVEVRQRGVVDDHYAVDMPAVQAMMRLGMCSLTGSEDVQMAWRRFFTADDVVGIKVNPVGRKALPGELGRVQSAPAAISSPEVLLETVRCLHEYVGMPKRNIIVFDRYADEFRQAGYEALLRTRPMEGVRWCASAHAYDNEQTAIDGQLVGGPRDLNVVGYDPDVFVSMGFAVPEHDPRDDRRFRSHLSLAVTRMMNKLITIPCLKDHKSAGVTLALKNLSHGLNNNVARSHISGIYRRDGVASGPNQCNSFIPTAVAQQPLMAKATLHILDGLIGVYEGGPGNWNRTWGFWPRESLFFATDPVALDHVGWDIIDAKRAAVGWAPVAQMGMMQQSEMWRLSPRLAALAAFGTPYGVAALALDHQQRRAELSEPFDRRQPEHIVLAGLLGLGTFNASAIDHRIHASVPLAG